MSLPSRDPSFRTAVLGFALVAPTVYFIGAAVLRYGLGIGFFFEPIEALSRNPETWRVFNVASAFVFLGGSLLALLLNALRLVRLTAHTEPGSVSGTITILRKPWNLAAAGLCFVVIAVMTAYLVAENWRCWVGLRTHC